MSLNSNIVQRVYERGHSLLPNRVASDCGMAAGLSEVSFKVARYFPTLIYSLEIPDSELLNAHLI